MKQTLDSSLLYLRSDGSQDFVHDTYRDFFLAKWFADRINSSALTVEDVWRERFSYVEDKELFGLGDIKLWHFEDNRLQRIESNKSWFNEDHSICDGGLAELADDGCRAMLPALQNVTTFLINMLEHERAIEFFDVATRSYFVVEERLAYNPFFDDLCFVARLSGTHYHLREDAPQVVDALIRKAQNGCAYERSDSVRSLSTAGIKEAEELRSRLPYSDYAHRDPHSHLFPELYEHFYREIGEDVNLESWMHEASQLSSWQLRSAGGDQIRLNHEKLISEKVIVVGHCRSIDPLAIEQYAYTLLRLGDKDTIKRLVPALRNGNAGLDLVYKVIHSIHQRLKPQGYIAPERGAT